MLPGFADETVLDLSAAKLQLNLKIVFHLRRLNDNCVHRYKHSSLVVVSCSRVNLSGVIGLFTIRCPSSCTWCDVYLPLPLDVRPKIKKLFKLEKNVGSCYSGVVDTLEN